MFYSSTPRSTPTVTLSTTPIPILLSPKSLSEPKSPSSIPLATLRVTMMSPPSTEQPEEQPVAEEHETSSEEPDTNVVDELEASNHENENTQPPMEEEHLADEETIYEQPEQLTGDEAIDAVEDTTSVEQRLKKISEEIEKYSNTDNDPHGRQSFFSLSDLIKTLRPSDKKVVPQIDSDYSNTMHVLGETASIVGGDDGRKIKTIDLRQTNRALF